MFSLIITDDSSDRFTLDRMLSNLNKSKKRLVESRIEIEPQLYDRYLQAREKYHKNPSRECCPDTSTLYPGSWYLKSIDENYRRFYDRVPPQSDVHMNIEPMRDAILKQLSDIKPVTC